MRPIDPIAPIDPMEPVPADEVWWPQELGQPSDVGSQGDLRYAVFADRQRLLIETGGSLATYDTGDHHVGGVIQADDGTKRLSFTSQHGLINLDQLSKLD